LVPSEDHSVVQQRNLLRTITADQTEYLGGMMICSGWPDHLMSELLEVLERLSVPVVLVDRNPPMSIDRIPSNIGYVSVRDAAGGELAANAVLQLSDDSPVRRILVVAGFAKRDRDRAFQAAIKKSRKLKRCEIVITEDGRFDRWVAENLTYNLLSEAIGKNRPFDVVFCTADSMTVGCLDAIARISHWAGHSKPRVVGYDGTVTTRSLVENRRSPLVRLVIQDGSLLASAAVEQLVLSSQDRRRHTDRVLWVEPYLYPSLRTVSA
jgi:DNA-binding LacI/PurR family transcriptional regulator